MLNLAMPVLALLMMMMAAASQPATRAAGVADALDREPAAPWEWLRPDPDARAIADGALQIHALSGTLWKNRNDAKNVLLRPWPKDAGDDAIAEVTVRFAPEKPGEQAGLILYFSDDDYVKIVREFLDGKRWVVFGREQAGDGKMIQRLPVESDEVTLRLIRHGQQITGDFRTGATRDESHPLGPTDLPPSKESLRVGLVAHGGPAAIADTRAATFHQFRITPAESR